MSLNKNGVLSTERDLPLDVSKALKNVNKQLAKLALKYSGEYAKFESAVYNRRDSKGSN